MKQIAVLLADIRIDGGTQVRAAIDQQVVADYAEAMTSGAAFPPIIVFRDGSDSWLADGFHRVMAAQRLSFRDILADVRAGTKDDAIWFALGANRENGKRLTEGDKQHAVALALAMWPHKLQREIAQQVGCSESLVSKMTAVAASNTGVAPELRGRALVNKTKRDKVRELLSAGVKTEAEVATRAGVARSFVSDVRTEMGLAPVLDRSRRGIDKRRERMRQMAEAGHTSRQIAAELHLSEAGCRGTLRELGIDVPADRAVGPSKRHDSNRIIERIVMDAENLTEGTNLIEFADLDRAQLSDWLRSLAESRDKFGAFIRRLQKEQQRNGEAA